MKMSKGSSRKNKQKGGKGRPEVGGIGKISKPSANKKKSRKTFSALKKETGGRSGGNNDGLWFAVRRKCFMGES